MVKKRIEDEEEEDFEEDELEEEAEEEEEAKPKKKPKRIDVSSWQLQVAPELFAAFNPKTKEIMAQAITKEDLILQLVLIAAQKSTEAAKNTE